MTDEELVRLREWIAEPASLEWNDDRLRAFYATAGGDLRATAALIWRTKANAAAGMPDITENGSSRKMSDIYKNFLAISKSFEDGEAGETPLAARPRTRAIVRP